MNKRRKVEPHLYVKLCTHVPGLAREFFVRYFDRLGLIMLVYASGDLYEFFKKKNVLRKQVFGLCLSTEVPTMVVTRYVYDYLVMSAE